MSEHVTTVERDGMKESLFKDAYNLSVRIRVTSYNDAKWNWDMVVMNFTDDAGKPYGLIEYFKPGDDNSTDHVDLEYTNKAGELVKETYPTFLSAELALVNLIRARLRGDG